MGAALETVPYIALFAFLGAVLCSLVAVIMKPLNLGLFENIALGGVCGGVAAYALRAMQVEPIGLAAMLQFLASLGPMVVIGLWLNARAR
ncbi:MAG: hypothetical protein AAF340_13920 [Pseudomonadota bacterium]